LQTFCCELPPFNRRIAATVHFAAGDAKELKDATPTEREVLDAVMKWKQRRKPPLDEKDAAVAIRNLAALGGSMFSPAVICCFKAIRCMKQ